MSTSQGRSSVSRFPARCHWRCHLMPIRAVLSRTVKMGQSHKSLRRKKKRPHAKTCDRSRWWGGELNPRPAGYESGCRSPELAVVSTTCGDADSVVATLVATGTGDNACESVLSAADLKRLLNALPPGLAHIVNVWNSLPVDVQDEIQQLVAHTIRATVHTV